jgi:alginate O-acetyltransferase complex protein AlgI
VLFERIAGWFITFNIFALSGIFFRSPDIVTAGEYAQGLTALSLTAEHTTPFVVLLIVVSVGLQFLRTDLVSKASALMRDCGPLRLGAALGGALLAIEMIGPSGVAPFIYFQF